MVKIKKEKEIDFVYLLTHQVDKRVNILRDMPLAERSVAFQKLSPYIQQSLLKQLKVHEIVELLDHMDMQLASRILTRIQNVKRREEILKKIKNEVREKIEYFLRFHPKASLSLINFNYLYLDGNLTIKAVADLIEEHYDETARYPEILVHENGNLIGEVSIAKIVKERNTSPLKKFVRSVEVISYQSEVKQIIEVLVNTNSKKIVVLDHDSSVLGVIYADAARQLFGNLPAVALYDYAGVDESEKPFDTIVKKVQNRYRWLILNLATCFLAGSVILGFQDTLDSITILSVYIPIVAGMGGNAATQSFAIMVRGITLGTISLQNSTLAIWRELGAGIINGVIIGSIVTLISALWNGEPILGLVVGLSLVGVHVIAAVAGTVIPLLMKHLGKDPAATSTIFISTMTDVGGLLVLFVLATLILL